MMLEIYRKGIEILIYPSAFISCFYLIFPIIMTAYHFVEDVPRHERELWTTHVRRKIYKYKPYYEDPWIIRLAFADYYKGPVCGCPTYNYYVFGWFLLTTIFNAVCLFLWPVVALVICVYCLLLLVRAVRRLQKVVVKLVVDNQC